MGDDERLLRRVEQQLKQALTYKPIEQVTQLSQRDRAAGCRLRGNGRYSS